MSQYRKKPVVIEAFEWMPNAPATATPQWFFDRTVAGLVDVNHDNSLSIKTLEGVMSAQPGDMIIMGVKGEIYPCKKDIFEATYEPVEPVEQPRTQTYGARAVESSLGPGSDIVESCKASFAAEIDGMRKVWENSQDPEIRRMAMVAIEHIQTAQMWAVKVITAKPAHPIPEGWTKTRENKPESERAVAHYPV